jgi:iron complex outermembrane recepter protein
MSGHSIGRRLATFACAIASLLLACSLKAQVANPPRDTAVKLGTVQITAERAPDAARTPIQVSTLPLTATITARRAEETVNLVDTEDAVKYLPSVFLRKRNNGDTQATMATRVWGVSSSARSLVFADGVPLSALIANNNTIGGPRWGLVSPSEIARVDMMYGPFSAAYAGNSMGAVMEITTRLPEKREGSINQTQAIQTFSLYGTRATYGTTQTSIDAGDRFGKLALRVSGNYQNSRSQPLLYVTTPSLPNGTTGAHAETNKLGAAANVLGASGLLHTRMASVKLKAAYDLTRTLRMTYTFGLWTNDANSSVEPYTTAAGQPTFAGQAGFASGFYDLAQQNHAQSLSLHTDRKKNWDVELIASRYSFDKDRQRFPASVSATGTTFDRAGRVAVLDGTHWSTVDVRGTWRPAGPAHTITAGAHFDRYELSNTTWNTSEWQRGPETTVFTQGDGKTQTTAVWAQEAWWITPALKLTAGARYEAWRAFDGVNVSGSTTVVQPRVSTSKFSPKASLAWAPVPEWTVTTSVGKAYRFATPSELYQLVSTGATFTSPNPDLEPDDVLATELRIERLFEHARVQLSVFQDDIHDAIISQFLPLVPNSPALYSYLANVDHVRARGVEVVAASHDVLVPGLELAASATYLDAKTLALSGRASATAPAGNAVGKRLPNIPEWRATFTTSYRRTDNLVLTLAGRYSSKLYTTLDNADVHPNTYQGFSEWFVMDTHTNYRMNRHWSLGGGVDNLLNRKYFLFHPFPQRTYVANVKYSL